MSRMVLDASSLILLTKVNMIEFLMNEFDLSVTETVREEAANYGSSDARKIEKYVEEGRIDTREVKGEAVEELAKDFNIDRGEASTLLTYRGGDADIVTTDDGKTIETCRVLDIPYTTSLALLEKAVDDGELSMDEGLAKLERLEDYGWYSQELLDRTESSIRGEKHE